MSRAIFFFLARWDIVQNELMRHPGVLVVVEMFVVVVVDVGKGGTNNVMKMLQLNFLNP